ncbi:SDR family oxidoreductase [Bradyrhizobium sp. C-145]|uniref:SDR family oxidoreductase n=1 Tax=Bradyrhizobium sp. C-145 TaxID=574727 RepID=UPI00201B72A9|nr:SDR family oxidoreductase [Bradyrhizobium sp. C-145]UQR68198.1 SDR family oxidoreductase [Bradyrhizobium sp. C-145]
MTSREKRIAWVTGGGSGIGLAGAAALAGDRWSVTISGRRLDALEAAAKRIGDKTSVEVDVLPLDVTRADDVRAAARSILAKHGQIDLLVNNAGLNVPKRSWNDLEIGGWDQIVDVNLSGVLYAIHAVLPAMRSRKTGSIINIASWAGRIVSQMSGPAYTATKHAILALTHSFNMDECRNGLRACCLSPGEVATPIMKNRPVPPSEEVMSKMLQPEDVGRTIAFVANMPPHVCVNEVLISPVANRAFLGAYTSADSGSFGVS